MSADRRRTLGEMGERLAEGHLVQRGYDIVTRNARTRFGELDLIAADHRCLVFCEVKTRVAGGRSGPATALEAIGPQKQRRLKRLARDWLGEHRAGPDRPGRDELRFDAIGVTVDASGELVALEHLEGAF